MSARASVRLLVFVIFLTCSFNEARGQSFFTDDEKVLVPMTVHLLPGASGAIWGSDLWVHNAGTTLAIINFPHDCPIMCVGTPIFVSPGEVAFIAAFPAAVSRPGQIVYVPREHSATVRFWSRVVDDSREGVSRGAEIPVVRERELFTTKLNLFPIPANDNRYRVTFHFYDVDSRPDARLAWRIYSTELPPTQLLASGEIMLRADIPHPRIAGGFLAGYARLDGLASFAPISTCPFPESCRTYRLEIESLTPGLRFWAFATLINNETQTVTTITPQ